MPNNPGDPLNTGTGGFPVSNDDRYTYDVGTTEGDETPRPKWNSGQINVDQAPRDLSQGTKRTLGSYLSKTTLGQTPSSPSSIANKYPIQHSPTQNPVDLNLKDQKGYPQQLTVIPQQQPHFGEIDSGRSLDSVNLNILRGRKEPSPNTDPRLDRTKDGNSLLPTALPPMGNVINPPEAGTVNSSIMSDRSPVKYYTEDLLNKNEYDNNARFIPPDRSLPLRSASDLDTTPVNSLTPVDLPEERKKTLRDYMSARTAASKNAYPLDSQNVENVSLTDANGNPVSPGVIKNDSTHVPFNYIQSRAVDVDIKRGKETSTSTVDGNTLLKNATDEAVLQQALGTVSPSSTGGKLPQLNLDAKVSKPISDYYSKSVIYNRFNQNGQNYEEQAAPNQTTRRGEFIKPSNNFPQFALKYNMGTSTANRDVTFARLAQIGNSLSVRSGFELNSFEPGNNPTSPTSEAAALLPGWTQLGVNKIGRDRLTAKSVLEDLTEQGIDGSLLIDPAGTSWGNLNNVNDQFAGISNFGMQLLAVALIVALVTAVAVTSALFLTNTSAMSASDENGRRPFGASLYDDSTAVDYTNILSVLGNLSSFNFWRMLGVPPTKNSLAECLTVGALSFFGINDTENVGRAVLQGATSVTQSAGYYSIIAREVNRSFLLIGESFKTLGRAFSSGRAVAGIGQLFGVIETLRNSKFLRVVAVFSRQGDKIIRDNSMPIDKLIDKQSRGASTRYFSDIDRLPNRGYSGKGRLTGQTAVSPLTLSWASYRASDLFLVPASYASLVYSSRAMDPPNLFPSIPEDEKGGVRPGTFVPVSEDKNRIDTDVREKMEADLESEYMPFYIHDVRTNEIISFHAFLASLTEDYAAAYDTAEAMGRVDPIKIYKSTVRKIGFSFYIAATNERDFDSMWMKINKLTTLVYPQFSRGDFLSANQTDPAQQQLVMPFSQVIQAPPMVRVRIGDLIRSNYSKFNLARLFGYGDPNVDLNGIGKMPEDRGPDTAHSAYLSTLESSSQGNTFTTRHPLSRPNTKKNILGITVSESAPQEGIVLPQGLVLKVENFDSSKKECTVKVVAGTPEDTGMSETAIKSVVDLYSDETAGSDRGIVGKSYIFNISQLVPTPSTSAKLSKPGTTMRKYADDMASFMDDDPKNNDKGNAISRSFRSSGGKGLAGFIESMAFDWYDRVTWETEVGRKAPKICKVTISFSPIHDITPGLDHRGVNRAPIYPVVSKRAPSKPST